MPDHTLGDLTPASIELEARLERCRMALAEAGWDPDSAEIVEGFVGVWAHMAPKAIIYTALLLAGVGIGCWTCWSGGNASACANGDCSHPDLPRRPPQELLTRPGVVLLRATEAGEQP